MDSTSLVQNVKELCKARGVLPTIACRESGAGKDLLNQMERRGSIPSVEKIQLLANYLGCTVSDLLGEKKEPTLVTESGPRDPLEAQLMNLVRQLSPDSKKMLIAQLEVLLRSQSP